MSVYEFTAEKANGEQVSLQEFQGKVLLIVNTASKCGFTPQYEDLEKLHQAYQGKGLAVLGFPSNQFAEQEPGSNEEVQEFCKLNYGVTFPVFAKGDVRGETAQPLFRYLSETVPFAGFGQTEKDKGLQGFLQANLPAYLEGNDIKWNFTKFLVDRAGNVVKRYESPVNPLDIAKDIENLL